MTAIACPQQRVFNPLPILLLAILAMAVVYGSHAVIKHGIEAEQVRECINKGGGIQLWKNSDTGRQAEVCLLPDGKFGVQVTRFKKEVTSFIKNKMTRIEQVENYLKNSGYKKQFP